MAEAARPPLTTVDMDLEALGRRAAGLLLARIDGDHASGVVRTPCRLVVRASTHPADPPADRGGRPPGAGAARYERAPPP
jgi:DNA-binding LacI/PurR family transcriptional regulator